MIVANGFVHNNLQKLNFFFLWLLINGDSNRTVNLWRKHTHNPPESTREWEKKQARTQQQTLLQMKLAEPFFLHLLVVRVMRFGCVFAMSMWRFSFVDLLTSPINAQISQCVSIFLHNFQTNGCHSKLNSIKNEWISVYPLEFRFSTAQTRVVVFLIE